MNAFIINSNLTVIKTKETCVRILATIKENNILSFKDSNNNKQITIMKDNDRPDSYVFYYHNEPIDWKTPGFSEDLESATKILYEYRKHYNAMWKD